MVNARLFIFAGLSVLFGIYAFKTTDIDWDAITYTGINLISHGSSLNDAHRKSYQLLAETTTEAEFQSLISETTYRQQVYQSPEFFENQFYLHSIKPLYLAVIHLLTLNDPSNTVTVIKLIAAVSGSAALFLLFYWLAVYTGNLTLVFGPIIFFMSGLSTVGKLSNPDALAGFLCLISLFFFLEKKSLKLMTAFAVPVLLIRPNYILLFLALFAADWLTSADKINRLKTIGIPVSLMLIIPVVVRLLAVDYSWWLQFYHSFVNPVADRTAFHVTVSVSLYFDVIYKMMRWAAHSYTPFPIMIFLAVLIGLNKDSEKADRMRILLVMGAVLIQFMIFPSVDYRFFIHFLSLILMLFVIRYSSQLTHGFRF